MYISKTWSSRDRFWLDPTYVDLDAKFDSSLIDLKVDYVLSNAALDAANFSLFYSLKATVVSNCVSFNASSCSTYVAYETVTTEGLPSGSSSGYCSLAFIIGSIETFKTSFTY